MESQSQRVVEPMVREPGPNLFPLTSAVSPGTSFFCHGDVIVCLIWQCLHWRSKDHCVLVASGNTQESPRRMPLSVPTTISNCQARDSDGVGAIPNVAGSACWNTTASSWQRQRGVGVLGLQPPFCLVPSTLPHTPRPFLPGKCPIYVSGGIPMASWKGKKRANQLGNFWASVSPSLKWIRRWEPDKTGSEISSRVPIPLWSEV